MAALQEEIFGMCSSSIKKGTYARIQKQMSDGQQRQLYFEEFWNFLFTLLRDYVVFA